jgi:Alg9-like mannosyltransferase family
MRRFIQKYPLWTCLIVALLLRLIAVVYSKGYMASDDHYETVQVAYDGIQFGLLNENGLLRWNSVWPGDIGRSPLYVLFLYTQMAALKALGIENLDAMMYFIRAVHALLSLLTIWFGYKYVHRATGKINYALLAGLILAGHFLMPYLSVRNLIEQVSADFLLPALFFAWKGTEENDSRLMIVSGLLAGLSWMIRFNAGLAVIMIPWAAWYLARNIRPALYFTSGLLVMILFSGTLDMIYLGSFGRSTLNILSSVIYPPGAPPIPQPLWTYAVLVLAVFIPPFSFYYMFSFFRRKIVAGHLILFSAAALFFIVHSFIRHKEERFLIPIFPLLVVMGTIGLQSWFSGNRITPFHRRLFRISGMAAVVINVTLLAVFTVHYGHKGSVEPFVYLSEQPDFRNVLVDRTERNILVPYAYAGFSSPIPIKIENWEMLGPSNRFYYKFDSINYFVIFTDTALSRHLDTLVDHFGPMKEVFHSTPSTLDRLLHFMNPAHNFTNESRVFKKD